MLRVIFNDKRSFQSPFSFLKGEQTRLKPFNTFKTGAPFVIMGQVFKDFLLAGGTVGYKLAQFLTPGGLFFVRP